MSGCRICRGRGIERSASLSDLATLERFVTWRNEERNGDITKVPYVPGENRKAKADDPTTWRSRADAEACASLIVGHLGGGVGIELGDLGDGRALGGIDLDACRTDDGTIESWAIDLMQRVGTYAEVSPSGTGAKAFFLYSAADLPDLLRAMQTEGGKQWKRGKGKHPPAIELYVAKRYFAETGQHLAFTPRHLRTLPTELLVEIITKIGPEFAQSGKAATLKDLARQGSDSSRSAAAFRLGARLRREGKTSEEFEAEIAADPETAEWYREKASKDGGRQLRKIWEKTDPGAIENAEWTEDGVAQAFTQKHAEDLRYCHDAGAWFEWNGQAWREDRTKRAFSWSRVMCREIRANASEKAKVTLAKASTAGAVERFAQADPAFAVTSALWDGDPWLLGTPTGTVDLKEGQFRRADRADFITKLTAVAPSKTPECPLWLAFLDQSTGSDAALIRFLRAWCGYTLTGMTREHALLFIYGPGGNGKSVFLNTVAYVLGDYCRTAAMETFTASQGDRHPTDLAMLRGARMVCASETEEGRAWAETRIKQMTGGDMVAARFMRQDFFEFRPQFKLTIVGNHKPVLRNVDEAARRRFNIVPFERKPTQPDRNLEAKLRAEAPDILRWMIDGCIDWQMNGLVRPQVVVDATSEYFAAQDHFTRWLDECCILDPSGTMKTKPASILKSFGDWCAENGEHASDSKRLRGQIEKTSGLRYVTVNGIQFVKGIGLKAPPSASRVEAGGGSSG